MAKWIRHLWMSSEALEDTVRGETTSKLFEQRKWHHTWSRSPVSSPPPKVMTLSTLPIAPMTKWRPPCCLEGELAEIEYRITSGHVWSLELFMPYQNFNTVRVGGTSFTTFHLTLIEDIHARFFPFSTMRSSVDVLSFYVKLCNNLCQWAYTAERSWNLFVRWTS